MIRHGPDDIDDGGVAVGPIDPLAVIGELLEVVAEPERTGDLDHRVPVFGANVQIEILGVAPEACERGHGESATDCEWNPAALGLLHDRGIDTPLILRNQMTP